MKKLLSIVSSTLLVISPTSLLVSCTNTKKILDSTSLKVAVEQIAKATYLSETEGYDFKYQFDDILKTKRIKDISSIYGQNTYTEDGLSSFSRFNDLYKYYFQNQLFTNNFKSSENILNGNIKPKNTSNLETLLVTMPNLLELLPNVITKLSEGNILSSIIDLILATPSIVQTIKNNYLFSYLNKILSPENASLLSNAFSNEIYKGFTNQETLNSAMIGFSNGIDYLVGNNNKLLVPTKGQSSGENFLISIEKLTNNLTLLNKKEKTIKLDLILDLPAIAEIIRFVRTLIVYTANGIKYIYTNEKQNETNYFSIINEYRQDDFSEDSNELDFMKMINLLSSTYANGDGIRMILSLMFQSYESPKLKSWLIIPNLGFISDESIQVEGITPLVQSFINSKFPTISLTEGLNPSIVAILKLFKLSKINIASFVVDLLNTLASNNNLNEMVKILNKEEVKFFIKQYIDLSKIKQLKKTKSLTTDSLWYGIYQGTIIKDLNNIFNENQMTDDFNIQKIIENPSLSVLGEKMSIKDLINNIDMESSNELKLNFSDISQLIVELRKVIDKVNGAEENFESKELIDNLNSILTNLKGFGRLTSWTTIPEAGEKDSLLDKYKQQQLDLKQKIKDDLIDITVSSISQSKNYSYQVNFEDKSYKIKLKMLKNKKFQVESIF
ncbi:hypothetical protein [Spiroplasma diminutum]|uniref:MOLPALP family lipoprotein n=1 Tax=Spiroplasma diminutum CUAS-1 TaxID=1276221 RepID=S5LZN2_9MOLU|nr:hypothetical protein [Spiroplasma diminutum]AGR42056.1 hypothetical protein SDIMI_v3c03520 [Spiroplasma diminutum CUAS-1]